MVTTILIIVHMTELIIVCSIIFLQVNDVFLCHTILINCTMFQEASEPKICLTNFYLWARSSAVVDVLILWNVASKY